MALKLKTLHIETCKRWQVTGEGESYWEIEVLALSDKIQWARHRCGNVGKAGNKGYENVDCRFCGEMEENMEHTSLCDRTKVEKQIDQKWLEEVDA